MLKVFAHWPKNKSHLVLSYELISLMLPQLFLNFKIHFINIHPKIYKSLSFIICDKAYMKILFSSIKPACYSILERIDSFNILLLKLIMIPVQWINFQ